MKITKKQLRRIIKEEKAKLLSETGYGAHAGQWASAAEAADPMTAKEWTENLGQIIDQDLSSRGVWYEDEGRAIISALEALRRQIGDKMRGDVR